MISPHIAFIRKKGVPLTEVSWNNFGLTLPDALEWIQLVKNSETIILGSDLFILKDGKLEHGDASWSINEKSTLPLERQKSSCLQMEEYLKAFPAPGDGTFLFCFTVSDDSTRNPDFKEERRWFEEGGDYQRAKDAEA